MSQDILLRETLNEVKALKSVVANLMKVVAPLASNYKPPVWMTRDEVMAELQIKVRRFNELIASGCFEYKGQGRAMQVKRRDVEAYQEGRILIPSKRKTA